MKKVTLLCTLIICALLSKAQTEKGNWMVGGTIGGLNFKSTGSANQVFTIGINPTVAKFVSANLAIGGGIDILYSKPKNANGAFDFGIVPLARYYFKRDGANGLFGQLRAGIGIHSYDDGVAGTDNSSTTFIGGVGVGYNRFLTDNVALEAGLAYTIYNPTKSGPATNNVGLNVGFQIFLPSKNARQILNR